MIDSDNFACCWVLSSEKKTNNTRKHMPSEKHHPLFHTFDSCLTSDSWSTKKARQPLSPDISRHTQRNTYPTMWHTLVTIIMSIMAMLSNHLVLKQRQCCTYRVISYQCQLSWHYCHLAVALVLKLYVWFCRVSGNCCLIDELRTAIADIGGKVPNLTFLATVGNTLFTV